MLSPAGTEFIKSVERYSHTDWAREQHTERICVSATRHLLLKCPSVLSDDFPFHLASNKRVTVDGSALLADRGCLCTDDDGILLLARKLTPLTPVCPDKPGGRAARLLDDEPTRIYVPLLMRPWMLQACHANASCHLGVARTFSMIERFYWWIDMKICTRWWLRRCLLCQARSLPD